MAHDVVRGPRARDALAVRPVDATAVSVQIEEREIIVRVVVQTKDRAPERDVTMVDAGRRAGSRRVPPFQV